MFCFLRKRGETKIFCVNQHYSTNAVKWALLVRTFTLCFFFIYVFIYCHYFAVWDKNPLIRSSMLLPTHCTWLHELLWRHWSQHKQNCVHLSLDIKIHSRILFAYDFWMKQNKQRDAFKALVETFASNSKRGGQPHWLYQRKCFMYLNCGLWRTRVVQFYWAMTLSYLFCLFWINSPILLVGKWVNKVLEDIKGALTSKSIAFFISLLLCWLVAFFFFFDYIILLTFKAGRISEGEVCEICGQLQIIFTC